MKTIFLRGCTSQDKKEIADKIAAILSKNSENDFQSDGENIIEYSPCGSSLYWSIGNINYNQDGTISHVNIDC